jgi:hypothetical protein
LVWRPAPRRAAASVDPAAIAAPPVVFGDGQQRSILTTIVRDDAVQPAAAEAKPGHSVVVRRAGPNDQGYDPFDEDDRERTAMLERRQQPGAQDPFDPFDPNSAQTPRSDEADASQSPEEQQPAEDAPQEEPAESTEEPAESTEGAADDSADRAQDADAEPATAPEEPADELPATERREPSASGVEDAFEEPQIMPRSQSPLDVESPDALSNELEQGATDEIVQPTTPALPEPSAIDDEMGDELPGADDAQPDIGVEEADEDADEELQYGGPLTGELPPMTPEQQEARRQELERDRAASERNCDRILTEVKDNRITDINLDISLKGNPGEDYPFECGLGDDRFVPRSWPEITYLWKASGLCSKPLYFEQVQLERYGHSWGPVLDPVMSGAHFFATVPILPYKMGIETPNECIYALGHYRPGNCAPYMIPAVPFTWRAAAYEAGAAAGVILIFP